MVQDYKEAASVSFELEEDSRWQLIERILATPGFARSARLSSFLIYVSRQSIIGRSSELNEQIIGEAVFERAVGYDPRDDNIVRAHASRLRVRLETYFREEGAHEVLRVSIPRGSYVPQFERVRKESIPPEPHRQTLTSSPLGTAQIEETLPKSSLQSTHFRRRKPMWSGVALMAAALLFVAVTLRLIHRDSHDLTPTHKLWAQMFRNDQNTLIVPADITLVIGKLIAGRSIGLTEYANGRYRTEALCDKPCDRALLQELESRRYTSMADLKFAAALSRLPESLPHRTQIRYVRDLQLEDFKQSNLILIGSQLADPWLSMLSPRANFILHDGTSAGPLRVENLTPRPHERKEYLFDNNDPQKRGLATLSFLPNLGGNGSILLVQGFTLAGTDAAAEFVMSGKDFDTLFQAYAGPKPRLPHFEVLLQTMDVNGMASRPTVLAWRTYP